MSKTLFGKPTDNRGRLRRLLRIDALLEALNGRGYSKFRTLYRLKREIGSGGFGTVYRAVRLQDRLPVAVKFIERENVTEWEKVEHVNVPLELSMLARCRKIDGVIQLMDWYSVPEGYIIVMERPSPCIDLHDFISSQRLLSEDIARFIFPQVVKAIAACAERQVLYRDIKVSGSLVPPALY